MTALTAFYGTPILVTGTGDVTKTTAVLIGFYVNSTTGGTIVINDGATAVSGTITPAIGWHFWPANFLTKLNVTIANTISVTFMVAGS